MTRVPQTDPWRRPPDQPRGHRVVIAFIAIGAALLVGVAIAVLASDDDPPAPTTTGARLQETGTGDIAGNEIRHLVTEKRVVVYPRYQPGPAALPSTILPAAIRGARRAFARLPAPRSVVAAGHSAGGALAADITAVAKRAGLPVPRAVLAVYPGRSFVGMPPQIHSRDLSRIPRSTEVFALASERDDVVGTRDARQIARDAHGELKLVTERSVAGHLAPTLATKAARRTFWAELDRLLRKTG